MSISSNPEVTKDWLSLLINVNHIIFDLNSMPQVFEEDQSESFKKIVSVLTERDFKVSLIFDDSDYFTQWNHEKKVSVINTNSKVKEISSNKNLFSSSHFWISESYELQEYLATQESYFAYHQLNVGHEEGLHFKYLHDLLELFNPSQQTALLMCDQIVKMKNKNPTKPLMIGIGGPDECGHAYFVGALIEELQKSEFIIEGIDLTELLSSEFHRSGYWRSTEIEQCMMDQLLVPFSEGERVFIEEVPPILADYETNLFPFFLAPEMILVIWGTSLFLPKIQKILDWNILLELSPKVATARLFGIDEREDFDPDFIKQYEKSDGRLYQDYLEKFKVESSLNHRINFDNFLAFRFK